jgi:hypothetical protein
METAVQQHQPTSQHSNTKRKTAILGSRHISAQRVKREKAMAAIQTAYWVSPHKEH